MCDCCDPKCRMPCSVDECPIVFYAKCILFLALIGVVIIVPIGDPEEYCKEIEDQGKTFEILCRLYKNSIIVSCRVIDILDAFICWMIDVLYELKLRMYSLLGKIDGKDLCTSACKKSSEDSVNKKNHNNNHHNNNNNNNKNNHNNNNHNNNNNHDNNNNNNKNNNNQNKNNHNNNNNNHKNNINNNNNNNHKNNNNNNHNNNKNNVEAKNSKNMKNRKSPSSSNQKITKKKSK